MIFGIKKRWRIYVGRRDYGYGPFVFEWSAGWIADADPGDIPWRHHGKIRLFAWVPQIMWRYRLPYPWMPVPAGVCWFGRCWRWMP